jgi:hypothetical protein
MSRPCVITAAGLALALFVGACGKSSEREPGDFERMRIQQRDEPYASGAPFADEERLRHPPAGTVSRESESDTGAIGSGMQAGRMAPVVPISITPERLSLGQRKYTVYCAVCHGAGGFGGSIVAVNMGAPRPPSLRSAAMAVKTPGYFFLIATHGIGRMPGYAPQLTVEERWAVVAYIGQLQRSTTTTPEARADSLRAVGIRSIDSVLASEQRR